MRKLLLLLVFVPALLKAQVIKFEQVGATLPAPTNVAELVEVEYSAIAYADIDGDNDLDLFITGKSPLDPQVPVSILYTNDGFGNFTKVEGTPFLNIYKGSVAFADVDGDNDQDLFIAGLTSVNTDTTMLYINDGDGDFSPSTTSHFTSIYLPSIAFADVDGDNDQDILISGSTLIYPNPFITQLYINDGLGYFSLTTGNAFDAYTASSLAFSDIDGDNDLDLLLTGHTISPYILAIELFVNDGIGNFTILQGTNFTPVQQSSIAFVDIDNDNDQDLIISGNNGVGGNYILITDMYVNDGSGNFNLLSGTPFTKVYGGSIAVADIDGDNDNDLLITGDSIDVINNTYNHIFKIYLNDGLGHFTFDAGTPNTDLLSSCIAFADIDGDNDKDLLVSGIRYVNTTQIFPTKLYINDGLGGFSYVSNTPFLNLFRSTVAFADVDGDNDQDVFIGGYHIAETSSEISNPNSSLYVNDGTGNYSLLNSTIFPSIYSGSVAFSDVDGDSDQDLIISGSLQTHDTTLLYLNDGLGNFSPSISSQFSSVSSSSIAFADVDGDNDQDLLIAGFGNTTNICELYSNDGSGNFTIVSGTNFTGVSDCSIAFADVDGDNDKDVLIVGMNNSNNNVSNLYKNDGLGNYTLVSGTPFSPIKEGSIAFADIDNDNDLDVFIAGKTNVSNPFYLSNLYVNDGIGNYTLVTSSTFENIGFCSVAFADVDNDNDQDLVITGQNSTTFGFTSNLYINDGVGNFSLFPNTALFPLVVESAIAFADIDGDSDQDILITGLIQANNCISRLYRNTTCYTSTGVDTQVTCNSYTWIDGNTYTSSNTTATYTLTNSTGCDSIVTLNLTINSNFGDTTASACDTFVWYGTTYTTTNDYTHILTNVLGCDSTVTLHLAINSTFSDTTVSVCNPFVWYGTTYDSTDDYTHVFSNVLGCDSTITLHLTINSNITDTTVIAYGSFTWLGSLYDSVGVFTDTTVFTNVLGCDSTIAIHLTVMPDTTVTLNGLVLTSGQTGANYQWLNYSNGYSEIVGETNQSYTLSNNGSYAVQISLNGLTDTSSIFSFNSLKLEDYTQSSYKLYPNPVKNELTIESQDELNQIEVFSITGQLLQTLTPQFKLVKIDLATYEKGVYLVKVHTKDGIVSTTRVVKE